MGRVHPSCQRMTRASDCPRQVVHPQSSDPRSSPHPGWRGGAPRPHAAQSRAGEESRPESRARRRRATQAGTGDCPAGRRRSKTGRADLFRRDRFLVGSPDTIIRQLQRFQETFGVDHLICRLYFPGLEHTFIMDELRLLAKEVLPAFKGVTA